MSLPSNVVRSSSLPDVKEMGEAGLLRSSRPLPSSFSPDVADDYVIFGGQQVRVRKSFTVSVDSMESGEREQTISPRATLKSPKNRLLYTTQNGNGSQRTLGIESYQADTNVLARCDSVGSQSPRPLSSRNQRIAALTAKVSELDALVSEVSPKKAGHGYQMEYSYKTPTAASTIVPDQGKPQRPFFPSPELDTVTPVAESESVLAETPGAAQHGGDVLALSIVADSFKLDGPKTTGRKKKGPPASLAQRLALGSADRRKLHSTTGGKAGTGAGGPGEEDLLAVGTPGQQPSSSSSSFLARKLSSARAHPYPTAPSPTKEVLTVGAQVSGGLSLLSPCSSTVPLPEQVPVTFHWQLRKAQLVAAGQPAVFLFIAHDNPQLGKTVSSQLGDQGFGSNSGSTSGSSMKSSNSSSQKARGGGGMLCMLECKDKASPVNTHFILGRIVYSGDYAGIEGAEALQPRGSACLVVTELSAVRGDLKQLTTRARDDIIEVDLANTPPGFSVPLRSEEDVRALLRPCVAHVDVILDPYHTSLQWFPYWEGARRMAPQFRSKGIGYLRLGDDMSQYGTAFLSLDAGHTYLDGGATTIVSQAAATPIHAGAGALLLSRTFSGSGSSGSGGVGLSGSCGGGAATPKFSATTGSAKLRLTRALSFEKDAASAGSPIFGTEAHHERENVPGNLAQDGRIPTGKTPFRSPRGGGAEQTATVKRSPRGTAPVAPSGGHSNSASGASGALRKISSSNSMKVPTRENPQWEACASALRDCVIAVKGGDGMKWAERVEAMQRLAAALNSVCHLPSAETFVGANATLLCEAITLVADSLAKQSNPHVLVACLSCVRAMECGALLSAHCWLSWRGLVLEAAYALRGANRMVHEAALGALAHLSSSEIGSIAVATLCTGGVVEDIVVGARSSGGTGGNSKKGITKAGSSNALSKEGSGSAAAAHGAGGAGAASGGKVTTAANTARVLNWVTGVVAAEYEQTVQRCAEGMVPLSVGRDLSGILRCAVALLSHREEGTREAAVELIVTALAVELLCGAAAQGGMAGLFALSKALSGDLLKVPGGTVKANTEALERLQTVEKALSPPILPLLAEIKTAYPRFLERILQQLAQAVSKVCLTAAVAATAAAQKAATARDREAPLSGRTVGSDTTQPLAGTVAASVSPRGLSSRPNPAAAAPTKKVALLDGRPALVREDSGLTDVSNASTPPYQYVTADLRPQQRTPLGSPRHDAVGQGVGAGDRSTFSSLADPSTAATGAGAGDGAGAGSILRSQSAKSPSTISPTAGLELDVERMQQGLQGIKMMRARSANAGSARPVGVVADAVEGGSNSSNSSNGTTSRAGSACRSSRRRILQPATSAVSATGTSPTLEPPSPVGRVSPGQSRTASAVAAQVAQQLGGMWYEAKLLLRQVPKHQAEWDAVQKIAGAAPVFFSDLAALSAQTRFPKGAILRQVLPFDEHTSSNDQAKGRVGTADSYLTALPAALQGHEAALQSLAERAAELRGVIRVKMADEADVTQAGAAVDMLGRFCGRVEVAAGVAGLAPMQLIQQLESAS